MQMLLLFNRPPGSRLLFAIEGFEQPSEGERQAPRVLSLHIILLLEYDVYYDSY